MTLHKIKILNALTLISASLLATGALSSCIKDEPLNAEADIERVSLVVSNPEQVFFQITDSAQNVISTDSVVTFHVRSSVDLTALAPRLTLTKGATCVPENGSTQDFSKGPVTYTVTSQDGRWKRRYFIEVRHQTVTVTDTIRYDFEHFELLSVNGQFYAWHNLLPDGTLGNDWASGNPGYDLSRQVTDTPLDYPTAPLADGYEGYGVKLTTKDTGTFGSWKGMPLAAGNLFIGNFDVAQALRDAMAATRFGKPFDKRPVKYTGYYKYKAGAHYQDKQKRIIEGKVDQGSIYAVFYRNHDANGNPIMLQGDNVLSSPDIVAVAQVPDIYGASEWTYFEIPFKYLQEIDPEILANRGYSLTVVFSSSIDGAIFQGAIGSELCVDKVRVICESQQ